MKENGFSRFLIKKAVFYRRGLGDKNCKERSDSVASFCERHRLGKSAVCSKQTSFVFSPYHRFPRFPQNQDFADFMR